jgi:hypothetical protein
MAAAGTAVYISDLLSAIKLLRSNVGDHLVFGMLPNLMINGCTDPARYGMFGDRDWQVGASLLQKL